MGNAGVSASDIAGIVVTVGFLLTAYTSVVIALTVWACTQ